MERKLEVNNMREVWNGMKDITGCKKSKNTAEGDVKRANKLNIFYNRFESATVFAATTVPLQHFSHQLQ